MAMLWSSAPTKRNALSRHLSGTALNLRMNVTLTVNSPTYASKMENANKKKRIVRLLEYALLITPCVQIDPASPD
jgi:hypothetical protein